MINILFFIIFDKTYNLYKKKNFIFFNKNNIELKIKKNNFYQKKITNIYNIFKIFDFNISKDFFFKKNSFELEKNFISNLNLEEENFITMKKKNTINLIKNANYIIYLKQLKDILEEKKLFILKKKDFLFKIKNQKFLENKEKIEIDLIKNEENIEETSKEIEKLLFQIEPYICKKKYKRFFIPFINLNKDKINFYIFKSYFFKKKIFQKKDNSFFNLNYFIYFNKNYSLLKINFIKNFFLFFQKSFIFNVFNMKINFYVNLTKKKILSYLEINEINKKKIQICFKRINIIEKKIKNIKNKSSNNCLDIIDLEIKINEIKEKILLIKLEIVNNLWYIIHYLIPLDYIKEVYEII